MPWGRRLGATFGMLALIGLCAAAMLSTYQGRFWSGYVGIEDDLETKAQTRLGELNVSGASVEADGQNLTVLLPADISAPSSTALVNELNSIDGVRGVETVTVDGAAPGVEPAPDQPEAEPASPNPATDERDDDLDPAGAHEQTDQPENPDEGRLVLRYEGYRVVVEGTVETEAGRGAVIRPANDLVGEDKVIDELQVIGGEGEDFRHAGTAGAALGRLNEWFHEATIILTDRALVVVGEAFDHDAAAEATEALTNLAESGGLTAAVETGFVVAPDAAGPEARAAVSDRLGALAVDSIEFGPDSAILTADSAATLDALASDLTAMDPAPFEIGAHTSSLGDPDLNLLLSYERAEAVAAHLRAAGIDPDLMTAVGHGAGVPIADGTTAEAHATNERVELVVTEGNN